MEDFLNPKLDFAVSGDNFYPLPYPVHVLSHVNKIFHEINQKLLKDAKEKTI